MCNLIKMRGNYIYKRLGKTIYYYRKKRNYSKFKLAKRAGVDRNYLSRIEIGSSNPSIIILIKICKALQITVYTLLKKI